MPLAQFLLSMMPDTSGNPLSAGNLYFYEVGTTDQKTMYSGDDESSSDALSQPIVLDGAGTRRSNPVYFTGKARLDIYTSANVLIASIPVVGTSLYAQDVLIDQTLSGGAHNDFSLTNVDAVLGLAEDSFGADDWEYQSTRSANTYAQAVEVKLRRVLDLADYYDPDAVPSTFDDALDNAIADLGSGGGSIFFPAGTYRINTAIVLNNLTNVHFFGEGKASIITQNTAAAGENVLFDITGTSSGIQFSDLQLQGTGTSITTASIGIETEATCSDIRIDRVYFSGTASGKGFNKAVYSLAARTKIAYSYFEYVQNTSAGIPVDIGSGGDDSRITHCYIDNSDGVPLRGVQLTSVARARIIDTTITESTTDGVRVTLSDETTIALCHIRDCTQNGLQVAGSNDCTVVSNTMKNNTYHGIFVGHSTATPCVGGTYGKNMLIGNTLSGFATTNAASSDATVTTGLNVAGNRMADNGQYGLVITTNDCSYTGNHIYSNSTSASGTYSAIHVTTLGAHYGGERNKVSNNFVRDAAGSRHQSCIKVVDSTDAAANNVSTTVITGNDFPEQNSDGTPLVWEYGVASQCIPQYHGNTSQGIYEPFRVITAAAALSSSDTGNTVFVNMALSSGNVTVTLPTTDNENYQHNGKIRIVIVEDHPINFLIVNAAGGVVLILDGGTAAAVTNVSCEVSKRAVLECTSYGGFWYVQFASNPVGGGAAPVWTPT